MERQLLRHCADLVLQQLEGFGQSFDLVEHEGRANDGARLDAGCLGNAAVEFDGTVGLLELLEIFRQGDQHVIVFAMQEIGELQIDQGNCFRPACADLGRGVEHLGSPLKHVLHQRFRHLACIDELLRRSEEGLIAGSFIKFCVNRLGNIRTAMARLETGIDIGHANDRWIRFIGSFEALCRFAPVTRHIRHHAAVEVAVDR